MKFQYDGLKKIKFGYTLNRNWILKFIKILQAWHSKYTVYYGEPIYYKIIIKFIKSEDFSHIYKEIIIYLK